MRQTYSNVRPCSIARIAARISLAGALLVVAAPASATAQSIEEDLSKQAEEHYERGRNFYKEGEYPDAAEELLKAYALSPEPLLLYNLALAEWKAGAIEQARATAIRASNEGLPKGVETRNSGRLAAFGVIAKSQTMTGSTDTEPVDARDQKVRPTPGKGKRERPTRKRFGSLGWVGVGLLGGGATGLGAALWMDQQVADAVNRARAAEASGEPDKAEQIYSEEVEPRQTAGRILLGTGATLAAGGLTLMIIEWSTAPPAAPEDRASGGPEGRLLGTGVILTPDRVGIQFRLRVP